MAKDRFDLLIVEDSEADASLLRILLEETPYCDFAMTFVTTLADALASLEAGPFDVILLDLGLPDSQGIDTLRRVVVETDLPVVVSTGAGEEETGVAAMQAGAADFLPKNERHANSVARALAYSVERHRLRLQVRQTEERARDVAEMTALSELAKDSGTSVTAAAFLEKPFREAEPESFFDLSKRYRVIIDQAEREKKYKTEIVSDRQLREFAGALGAWRLGPRDVVDLHMSALSDAGADANLRRKKMLAEEARFLLIELLGYLVMYYRRLVTSSRGRAHGG